jgi:hypothetical protein
MTQRETGSNTTWGIAPQVRRAIRAYVLSSRIALEEDFSRQLTTLGVTGDGVGEIPGGRALTADEQRARDAASAVIDVTVATGASGDEAFWTFVRDCAFTTLNRLVGLRCLEERGMLVVDGSTETAIRVDQALGGSSLYFRVRNELPGSTAPRDVWRETLDRAYRAISGRIGLLFDPDSEFGQLFPLAATLTALIDGLNDPDIPADTWGDDEVLGWVYQYYNAEEKDTVYDKLAAKGKIEHPEELAAATCLYTERYMVDFLLQNTLGALWRQMHPDTRLLEGWPYFVKRPNGEMDSEALPTRVRDITLLDPACGSGHFLARAFDVFAKLYEEEGLESPDDVAQLILERNLHGIDIDLRAIQISALRLFLKGCELASADFRPRRLNLVSTDVVLPPAPPRDFLARFEDDRALRDVIRAIWGELRDAPILGSLLHPERKIDELLESRRSKGNTLELQDNAAWDRFRNDLLEGLRQQFESEAQSTDIGRRLFGEQAAKGVSLIEALGRRYDVVVTNPPYAGWGNLNQELKQFLASQYEVGKQDLFAAFVLRCSEFLRPGGRAGMVTQHTWMFLRSFRRFRQAILEGTTIDALVHLGEHGFEESAAAGAFAVAFSFRALPLAESHSIQAARLVGLTSPGAKDAALRDAILKGALYSANQLALARLPNASLAYWLPSRLLEILSEPSMLVVSEGLGTRDEERFVRCFWEAGWDRDSWVPYSKGGGFRRWFGLRQWVVDWDRSGAAVKEYIRATYPPDKFTLLIRHESLYFTPCLTYSTLARGSLGARDNERSLFSDAGPGIFPEGLPNSIVLSQLNARLSSYLVRSLSGSLTAKQAYVQGLPITRRFEKPRTRLAACCVALRRMLVADDPIERDYVSPQLGSRTISPLEPHAYDIESLLHTLEGYNERMVFDAYELDEMDIQAVLDETGMPAGWHSLISGYDALPKPPEGVDLPEGLTGFLDELEHRELDPTELDALKERLRTLYVAGPGAKVQEEAAPSGEDGEEQVLGAHIPIPTETFLEELSVKLGVHPISVFHLLQEMREQEDLVCPPEMRRALEDYVVVTVLRLLGFRWPEQDAYEATNGPIVPPEHVDPDGVIPLVPCNDEPTLEQRVRARMEHQFGEEGAEAALGEFRRYVGKNLGTWLAKEFFRTHTQRFKNRPIAWHLTSREGTFQALVLYHRLSRDTLQRISNLYAAGLINRLKAELQLATERGDERKAQDVRFQIEDVEEFRDRLRAIEEGRELANRIRCRWKDEDADGRPGPYGPDIDDGVKVNIRPFQETGLLTRPVIKKW